MNVPEMKWFTVCIRPQLTTMFDVKAMSYLEAALDVALCNCMGSGDLHFLVIRSGRQVPVSVRRTCVVDQVQRKMAVTVETLFDGDKQEIS